MIILGIDPGTAATGYGIIKSQESRQRRGSLASLRGRSGPEAAKTKNQKPLECIDFGCIRTEPDLPTGERLHIVQKELKKIIKKHRPNILAVEDIFFFKNLKTAVVVSQAKGVILLTAAKMRLPIYEYTPLQIKQATTSYGRADKQQIQRMVKYLLRLEEPPKPDDAADALATAICCAYDCESRRA